MNMVFLLNVKDVVGKIILFYRIICFMLFYCFCKLYCCNIYCYYVMISLYNILL